MRADALGLPITLDVEGARVVIVGEGEDAERKRALVAESGGAVELIAADAFTNELLDGARVALVCAHDAALAARVAEAARARGVLVWCSDDPAHSDFAMPAVARLGQARIAVATGGGAPALASRLRAAIEEQLGEAFARFVAELAELRARVQREEPDFERRRARLAQALDGFVVELRARYPGWFRST